MNTKKKLLFSFVGLILAISVFATVVFAWFAISSATSDFIVETGNLETDTHLYHAKAQFDQDGKITSYVYTEVVKDTDASKLFENMIPGQILTFQLEVSNKKESTVKTNYTINLGEIYYGTGAVKNDKMEEITFGLIDELSDVTNNLDANKQHFLYAINMIVEQVADDVTFAEGADAIDVSKITGVKIADTSTYKPIAEKLTLVEKIESAKKVLASGGSLDMSSTDIYIIKFYFDPTYGVPDSNLFMKKAFKIGSIVVNYTQEQKITE